MHFFIDTLTTIHTDLESKGKAEVNIAKQRNGPTKAVQVAFVENTATFQNLARSDRFPPQYYDENDDPFRRKIQYKYLIWIFQNTF